MNHDEIKNFEEDIFYHVQSEMASEIHKEAYYLYFVTGIKAFRRVRSSLTSILASI